MRSSLLAKAALAVGALCIVSAVSPVQAFTNLLTNPDLDLTSVSSQALATPTNWTVVSTKSTTGAFTDGASSETFCNVSNPGGYGLFFKSFQGSLANPNTGAPADLVTTALYQDNPATAGLTYTMTGYAGAGTGYIGLSDSSVKSEFHLMFLDASNAVIGDSTLNLVAGGLGTPNSMAFGYKNFSLSALAPAGTVMVRTEALQANSYANPSGGDQAFVVDTFTLTVPEPASLGFVGTMIGASLLRRKHSAK